MSALKEQESEQLFFQVTPAGAYYATMTQEPEAQRALLLQLLSSDTSVPYIPALLSKLTGLDESSAEALLREMTEQELLALTAQPELTVSGALEQILPDLISPLGEGKVLLSDEQGFCLAHQGFSTDEADAVSGLAADLLMLQERHDRLINTHLGLMSSSWALVNAVGQSELGFWVLYIGREKFLLAIEGLPFLNRQPFVDLSSVLIRRYLDH